MASLYDKFMYPAAHEQKYLTRQDWATSPEMYHKEIMDDYVTNVSKNLSEIPYVGKYLSLGAELGAPIASATLSLPYDLKQSFDDFEKNLAENPDKYNTLGSTIGGIMTAIDEQNPLSSLYHRTVGSLQPIKRRITGPNYIERQLNFKQQQLMNRRKQQMQQTIRQAEAAAKAKADAAAAAAAAKKAGAGGGGYSPSKYYNPTTQQYQSPSSFKAEKSFSYKDPNTGEQKTGYRGGRAQGGLADLYRHGGFSG